MSSGVSRIKTKNKLDHTIYGIRVRLDVIEYKNGEVLWSLRVNYTQTP